MASNSNFSSNESDRSETNKELILWENVLDNIKAHLVNPIQRIFPSFEYCLEKDYANYIHKDILPSKLQCKDIQEIILIYASRKEKYVYITYDYDGKNGIKTKVIDLDENFAKNCKDEVTKIINYLGGKVKPESIDSFVFKRYQAEVNNITQKPS